MGDFSPYTPVIGAKIDPLTPRESPLRSVPDNVSIAKKCRAPAVDVRLMVFAWHECEDTHRAGSNG